MAKKNHHSWARVTIGTNPITARVCAVSARTVGAAVAQARRILQKPTPSIRESGEWKGVSVEWLPR